MFFMSRTIKANSAPIIVQFDGFKINFFAFFHEVVGRKKLSNHSEGISDRSSALACQNVAGLNAIMNHRVIAGASLWPRYITEHTFGSRVLNDGSSREACQLAGG